MRPTNRQLSRRSLLLASLAVLTLSLSCSREPSRPRNVVLIVVDTLRADHLGCYGWKRPTSPALDGLAATGFSFNRAYAPSPWTKPSIASVLTGLYPGSHTVTQLTSRLPAEVDTLAEILAARGYSTAGVISHMLLTRSESNFQQGFEHYLQVVGENPHLAISTDEVTDNAQRLLGTLAKSDKPFFLFVHYFDPHYDYMRHPRIGFAPERAGALDGSEDYGELWEIMERDGLTPEEIGLVEAIYDEEIRHTDDGIGRLLQSLTDLGLGGDTLVVATSDHGEEFLDHGLLGHNHSLYEELVRVPLIVRLPGAETAQSSIDTPVSILSVPPTILELLGLQAADTRFQAGSIASLLAGDVPDEEPELFFEVDFGVGPEAVHKKGLLADGHKLVRDDRSGALELYDLTRDPGEQSDLSVVDPDRLAGMVPALDDAIDRSRELAHEPEETELSEEQREKLRSLGYLGP